MHPAAPAFAARPAPTPPSAAPATVAAAPTYRAAIFSTDSGWHRYPATSHSTCAAGRAGSGRSMIVRETTKVIGTATAAAIRGA